MPDKQEIPIARYDMIAVTRCGEGWQELQREPEGDWMRYEDHLAAISTLAHQLSQEKAVNAQQQQIILNKGAALLDWESREAGVCPEDVGFEEFIGVLKSENGRLTEALRVKEEECDRLRDRERDVCAAVTRQCDVKKINEIMQDTLKARDDRALLAARRTQERDAAA